MNSVQRELFVLIYDRYPFRLRVDDIIRLDSRLGRVIRVTESSAVILVNQPRREFKTRFDKPVRFQPPPKTFRISANAESEIVYRPSFKPRKRRERRVA